MKKEHIQMKKEHILKKKETKLREKLAPILRDSPEDYPIGNPYKKVSKADYKVLGNWVRAHREANPISDEVKKEMEEMSARWKKEDEALAYKEKQKKAWRLFFK